MTCWLCDEYHKDDHGTRRTPPQVAEHGTEQLRNELQACITEEHALAESRTTYYHFAQRKKEEHALSEEKLKQAAGELRTVKEEYSSKNDDMEHVELELHNMHLEWAEWCVEYKEEADSQRTDTQCEAFAEMNQTQLEEAAQAYTQLGQKLSDQAKVSVKVPLTRL